MRTLFVFLCVFAFAAATVRAQALPNSRANRAGAPSSTPLPPPKAADADAPLAEGWPGGTDPGKIEIKHYPAYRSAVARAGKTSQGADGVLFWSLFTHISRSGVEMTAPVVNTYSDAKMLEDRKALGDISMEFVYRSPKQGTAGPGVGAVKVEDHPAQTYVCIGLQGKMSEDQMNDALKNLRSWLDEHKTEWVAIGQPRRLGYHGPMTPTARRLWELQIPVKPVGGNK